LKFFFDNKEVIQNSFDIIPEIINNKLSVKISLENRGVYKIQRIEISTKFPFHLFKSITYFNTELNCIVYPKRDFEFAESLLENKNFGIDNELFTIRNYIAGDPIKRIAWKKSKMRELFTKVLEINPIAEQTYKVLPLTGISLEKHLSQITESLYYCQTINAPFHFYIDDKYISNIENDNTKFISCLELLASYQGATIET
jgi:hypothetical protein